MSRRALAAVARRRSAAAAATLVLLAGGAGCGQKGPLLLPGSATAPGAPNGAQEGEERDADEGRNDE